MDSLPNAVFDQGFQRDIRLFRQQALPFWQTEHKRKCPLCVNSKASRFKAALNIRKVRQRFARLGHDPIFEGLIACSRMDAVSAEHDRAWRGLGNMTTKRGFTDTRRANN